MNGTPTNPYNDQPTVRLVGPTGTPLEPISQREAARLLRTGQAELLFDVPPGIQLSCAIPDDPTAPAAVRQGQFLHARQGQLYGNVVFQSPDGEVMFHGDAEKALWYLNRGLVEVIHRDPPVLRFRFTPGGVGHAGDPFYLGAKENRCVVCAATQGLNRHHVVPSVYRRHFPPQVKEHAHHDVVLLCLVCHERYEREADSLKAELGRACGVPPHGLRGETDRQRNRAIRFARTLQLDGLHIPPGRQEEMRRLIGAWLGKWPIAEADIAAMAEIDPRSDEGGVEHGRQVVAGVPDIQAFVRRWREHFLRVMQPGYLPEHWDIDRPAGRRHDRPMP